MRNFKKVLAVVLVVALSVSTGIMGTLAYLTDRDSKVNVFTVGDVAIRLDEVFEQGATLLPGADIEKKPTITNTGKNDAWVWATIAFPAAFDNDDASKNVVHFNYEADYVNVNMWTWKNDSGNWNYTTEKIDGVEYNVYTVLYQTALKPGATTEPVMTNVYMDTNVDIAPDGQWYVVENGKITNVDWNSNTNGNPLIYVSAYAIQAKGFANVNEAYKAYIGQWKELEKPEGVKVEKPATDAEAEAALTENKKNIVVSLESDITYDVAAWANDRMGGEATESITILGNGHTITFNQTNSDWNNITTANGAKLIINNAKITNKGYNDGPWNRHDLNFDCDVELYNVTSDKALAFKAGAKLNNVTIDDANTSDTYAIWIQPNGQTVTIENSTIDMLDATDGRGIKIDEQYVGTPEKVTLVVKDTTFKTEEKSAIIVKSKAGADITIENVDITGVAADSVNPVWVDEASAAYADLVTVTGGTVVPEP